MKDEKNVNGKVVDIQKTINHLNKIAHQYTNSNCVDMKLVGIENKKICKILQNFQDRLSALEKKQDAI